MKFNAALHLRSVMLLLADVPFNLSMLSIKQLDSSNLLIDGYSDDYKHFQADRMPAFLISDRGDVLEINLVHISVSITCF